jgi:hypothetical protein
VTKIARSVIPMGSWPRRMTAEIAAGYCGEITVKEFLSRVGTEYPRPRIDDGERRLWLKDDLDKAIVPAEIREAEDAAAVL